MLQTVTQRVGEHARDIFRNFSNSAARPDFAEKTRIDYSNTVSGGIGLPLYEYRCTSCGYSFEKIQNFSAEPERECPKCQGVLIRPVTAPALRFEGAGWYVNDYAGKGGAKKADGAADAPAAGSDTSAAKESKTETKSSDGGATSAPAAPTAAPAAASTTASSSPTS
jgi:putative FmdB family regulatory protein